MLAKLTGPDFDSSVEFVHPDIWERQEYSSFSRLLIGSRQDEILLMLDLAKELGGPFLVVYVLLGSRVGHQPARYESPAQIAFEQLELFLWSYKDYFEQDGRLHLWVISVPSNGQLIFDNHNMIYAYGPLDRFEELLRARGYLPGEVRIPAPHCHNFHRDFDAAEDEVMSYWRWLQSPLHEDDDP